MPPFEVFILEINLRRLVHNPYKLLTALGLGRDMFFSI